MGNATDRGGPVSCGSVSKAKSAAQALRKPPLVPISHHIESNDAPAAASKTVARPPALKKVLLPILGFADPIYRKAGGVGGRSQWSVFAPQPPFGGLKCWEGREVSVRMARL